MDASNPMWNAILKWSVQQTDTTSSEPAKPMSEEDRAFLDRVFKSMVVDVGGRMRRDVMVLRVPESAEGLREAVQALRPEDDAEVAAAAGGAEEDEDAMTPAARRHLAAQQLAAQAASEDEVRALVVRQKVAALDDIAELCDDINVAVDFCKVEGGVGTVLDALRSEHEPLPELASQALANMAQNNPAAQKAVLEAGAVPRLLEAAAHPRPDAQAKALLALSALVDHCEPALDALAEAGGLEAALALLDSPAPRVCRKALVLARKVTSQRPDTLARAAGAATLDALARAVGHDDVSLRELVAELCADMLARGGETADAVRAHAALPGRLRARLVETQGFSQEDKDMCLEEMESLTAAVGALG